MAPDDIILMFREKWVGTDAELAEALEVFALDMLPFTDRAFVYEGVGDYRDDQLDYFTNHYGIDNIKGV